jgi:hypothetical protein
MAQAVSRRPLTAAARVRAGVNPVGFVVDKVALRQDCDALQEVKEGLKQAETCLSI